MYDGFWGRLVVFCVLWIVRSYVVRLDCPYQTVIPTILGMHFHTNKTNINRRWQLQTIVGDRRARSSIGGGSGGDTIKMVAEASWQRRWWDNDYDNGSSDSVGAGFAWRRQCGGDNDGSEAGTVTAKRRQRARRRRRRCRRHRLRLAMTAATKWQQRRRRRGGSDDGKTMATSTAAGTYLSASGSGRISTVWGFGRRGEANSGWHGSVLWTILKKLLRHLLLAGADATHREAQSGWRLNVSTSFKIIMCINIFTLLLRPLTLVDSKGLVSHALLSYVCPQCDNTYRMVHIWSKWGLFRVIVGVPTDDIITTTYAPIRGGFGGFGELRK